MSYITSINPGRWFHLAEPTGNQVYSGYFPQFPERIKLEPAGNIHKRWKEFSDRDLPVPKLLAAESFQVPQKKRNSPISRKMIMGTTPHPDGNDGK
jgi:hypothetical protein